LREISLRCWDTFALRGYARVDFRVDNQGVPFVLEINANPCLSPDAGFAAALEQAKTEYHEAIDFIIESAMK
jgi:D-alanine-D-alanine ligase